MEWTCRERIGVWEFEVRREPSPSLTKCLVRFQHASTHLNQTRQDYDPQILVSTDANWLRRSLSALCLESWRRCAVQRHAIACYCVDGALQLSSPRKVSQFYPFPCLGAFAYAWNGWARSDVLESIFEKLSNCSMWRLDMVLVFWLTFEATWFLLSWSWSIILKLVSKNWQMDRDCILVRCPTLPKWYHMN